MLYESESSQPEKMSRAQPWLEALEVVGELSLGEHRAAAGALTLAGLAAGGTELAQPLLGCSVHLGRSHLTRDVRVGVVERLRLLAIGDKEAAVLLLHGLSGSVVVGTLPLPQDLRDPPQAGWLVEVGLDEAPEVGLGDPLLDGRRSPLRRHPALPGGRVVGPQQPPRLAAFLHRLLQLGVQRPGLGVHSAGDVSPARRAQSLGESGGERLGGDLRRIRPGQGFLAVRLEGHPVGPVDRPLGLPREPLGCGRGPGGEQHRQVVAAQIAPHTPGGPPGEGATADGQVGGRTAARPVAGVRRLSGVERQPARPVEPVSHPLPDVVRGVAPVVPEWVVGVEVTQDDDVVAGW